MDDSAENVWLEAYSLAGATETLLRAFTDECATEEDLDWFWDQFVERFQRLDSHFGGAQWEQVVTGNAVANIRVAGAHRSYLELVWARASQAYRLFWASCLEDPTERDRRRMFGDYGSPERLNLKAACSHPDYLQKQLLAIPSLTISLEALRVQLEFESRRATREAKPATTDRDSENQKILALPPHECLGHLEIGNGVFGFGGREIPLTEMPLKVLKMFVDARPGRRLGYAELHKAWDGQVVGNEAIKGIIADLRKSLRAACATSGVECDDPLPHYRGAGWTLEVPRKIGKSR